MNVPANLVDAFLRGMGFGGVGTVLWLFLTAWLDRRWVAKRSLASRKIMERLGR